MGGSAVDLALVAEAIGKANAPDPLLEHGILPALLLERGGATEALEGVLAGETIATLAWTERGQRYSLKAKGMKADGAEGSVTLTGEKTMVMGALIADLFIVTADMGGETACFLVPKGARAGSAGLSPCRWQHRGRVETDPHPCRCQAVAGFGRACCRRC